MCTLPSVARGCFVATTTAAATVSTSAPPPPSCQTCRPRCLGQLLLQHSKPWRDLRVSGCGIGAVSRRRGWPAGCGRDPTYAAPSHMQRGHCSASRCGAFQTCPARREPRGSRRAPPLCSVARLQTNTTGLSTDVFQELVVVRAEFDWCPTWTMPRSSERKRNGKRKRNGLCCAYGSSASGCRQRQLSLVPLRNVQSHQTSRV